MSERAMRIRRPAVAGAFYPSDPTALRDAVAAAFELAVRPDPDAPVPAATIVPHAGYVYSGPIAASAYLRVAPARQRIRRVVLLGPSHRVPLRGLGLSSASAWATPLGTVAIDADAGAPLADLAHVGIDDHAHAHEHSLEVQLPFLQTVLDDFVLVPIVVGDATADEVAMVLHRLWSPADTLVVVSTDLSHYHRYEEAVRLDAATAGAIAARSARSIGDDDACGARGVRGLLATALDLDLSVEALDVRNSGDTAGDRDRVVGYGAFAVG